MVWVLWCLGLRDGHRKVYREFVWLVGFLDMPRWGSYHWDHWGWERGAGIGPESDCMVAPLGPEYVRSTYMDHVCARASGISRIGRLVF